MRLPASFPGPVRQRSCWHSPAAAQVFPQPFTTAEGSSPCAPPKRRAPPCPKIFLFAPSQQAYVSFECACCCLEEMRGGETGSRHARLIAAVRAAPHQAHVQKEALQQCGQEAQVRFTQCQPRHHQLFAPARLSAQPAACFAWLSSHSAARQRDAASARSSSSTRHHAMPSLMLAALLCLSLSLMNRHLSPEQRRERRETYERSPEEDEEES